MKFHSILLALIMEHGNISIVETNHWTHTNAMDFEKYEQTMMRPYDRRDPDYADQLNAYRAHCADKKDLFRFDLEHEHQTHEWSERIRNEMFRLAWDRGHSAGYEEVCGEYKELVELVLMDRLNRK